MAYILFLKFRYCIVIPMSYNCGANLTNVLNPCYWIFDFMW